MLKFRARIHMLSSLVITIPKRKLREQGWEVGTPLLITIRGTTFQKPLGRINEMIIPKPILDALDLREREVIEVKVRRKGGD